MPVPSQPSIVLRCGAFEATVVPDLGMLVASLRHDGDELLSARRGVEAFAERGVPLGMPLLHPWANRLSEDTFAIDSRTVDARASLHVGGLPIHGLASVSGPWTVRREATNWVVAHLDWFEERLLRWFPFPHRISVEHRLTEHGLRTRTRVEGETPVALGWHPFLQLAGEERADWRVRVPATATVELDGSGLPTGRRVERRPFDSALGTVQFDDLVTDLLDEPFVLEGTRRRITMRFEEGVEYVQVFAPLAEDVVSFEPMAAPTNALVTGDALPWAPYDQCFEINVERR